MRKHDNKLSQALPPRAKDIDLPRLGHSSSQGTVSMVFDVTVIDPGICKGSRLVRL